MYIEEIDYQDPVSLAASFANQPGTIFLDSSAYSEQYGRYSYLAISPFEIIAGKYPNLPNPFTTLDNAYRPGEEYNTSELPPFCGGWSGLFGYDLRHYLETVKSATTSILDFPDIYLGNYDLVVAWDQLQLRSWIFSTGEPETSSYLKKQRSKQRLAWLKQNIHTIKPSKITLAKEHLQFTSNFTSIEYMQAVKTIQEYIRNGDIFEANFTQQFSAQYNSLNPWDIYVAIRNSNPAPFASFINIDNNKYILSASPERFLQLQNHVIEARPIKGTAPRYLDTTQDIKSKEKLLHSAKDHAENVMIVDLLRNDISRVCQPHSLTVPQLCGLETFANVHHLVSVIQATLQPDLTAVDLLRATFPGGSITGAPKIRAMDVITEIEAVTRGPYCGSIGYLSNNGCMDLSIVIRTIALSNGKLVIGAGGAVTLDSDPLAEYQESLLKANKLLATLGNDHHRL